MRLLVDTHAFFWWATTDRKLSVRARVALEDDANEILISPVVAWELATKTRLGKWPEAHRAVAEMEDFVAANGLHQLPVLIGHGLLAGSLPGDHRDPFDRMLAAQSRIERVPLITADPAFRGFGVEVFW
jgi:PIN domain nuclease of toxin-antitoxin system